MRVHVLRIEEVPNGKDTDYVVLCSCGWERLPTTSRWNAVTAVCDVFKAEQEGDERRRKRLRSAA